MKEADTCILCCDWNSSFETRKRATLSDVGNGDRFRGSLAVLLYFRLVSSMSPTSQFMFVTLLCSVIRAASDPARSSLARNPHRNGRGAFPIAALAPLFSDRQLLLRLFIFRHGRRFPRPDTT